jgi:hypothetical protein
MADDDFFDGVKRSAQSALDEGKSRIRAEAAAGAREAVMPWVVLALALSVLALSRKAR